jgi:23S rRNA (guanine745-N1)-methyltransferase
MLTCTVRGCGLALAQDARAWRCPEGHSYDIARSGYVNLLQPQDRRSLDAGDSKDAVDARARLVAAGLGRALVAAFVEALTTGGPALQPPPQVVDLGCGTGHLLAAVASRHAVRGVGIDLSPAAIDHAARQHPGLTWVVANADRRLPLPDASVSALLSMHARRNPAECARVLAPGGALIVAVPAADDLIELRALVQGEGAARDRAAALIAEHAGSFAVARQETVRERRHLIGDVLRDLLRITYRGARHAAAASVEQLTELDVTLASDLVVFAKR